MWHAEKIELMAKQSLLWGSRGAPCQAAAHWTAQLLLGADREQPSACCTAANRALTGTPHTASDSGHGKVEDNARQWNKWVSFFLFYFIFLRKTPVGTVDKLCNQCKPDHHVAPVTLTTSLPCCMHCSQAKAQDSVSHHLEDVRKCVRNDRKSFPGPKGLVYTHLCLSNNCLADENTHHRHVYELLTSDAKKWGPI